MAGDGLPGEAAVVAFDKRRDIVGAAFAAADFEEGADDGAHHVSQKPVGGNPEVPVHRFFRRKASCEGVIRPGNARTVGPLRDTDGPFARRGWQKASDGPHDADMRGHVRCPERLEHGADRGLVVAPDLLETRKIMRSHQHRRSPVHGIEIHIRIPVLPRKLLHERILPSVQEICVFASHRIEARMEFRGGGLHRKYSYRTGQDGI